MVVILIRFVTKKHFINTRLSPRIKFRNLLFFTTFD